MDKENKAPVDQEAREILTFGWTRRQAAQEPADRTTAGAQLIESLLESARAAGLDAGRGNKHEKYFVIVDSARRVVAIQQSRGDIQVGAVVNKAAPAWKVVDGIVFDDVVGAFVGLAYDETRHPVPGERKVRRSAVAVVAEAVNEAFDRAQPAEA